MNEMYATEGYVKELYVYHDGNDHLLRNMRYHLIYVIK
jgi:hypothetical protein